MQDVTEQAVRGLLERRGFSADADGKYTVPYPLQYFGGDEDNTLWRTVFLSKETPMEAFHRAVSEQLMLEPESCFEHWAEYEFMPAIAALYDVRLDGAEQIKVTDQTAELLQSLVRFDLSEESLLSAPLRTVITVDTGDAGWDFTANTVPPAYGADHTLKEAEDIASIVWLVKQQGHKKGELYYALRHIRGDSDSIRTDFLRSVAEEVWHTLSCFTPLCFFLTLTAYDILLIRSLQQWSEETGKWGGYLVITPQTPTGFYTDDVGSSSLVSISLEREVKLPVKYLYHAVPDFYHRYPYSGIMDEYANWEDGGISYVSLPKHFRRSMEQYGLKPVMKNTRRT